MSRPRNVFAPVIAAAFLVVISGYVTIRLGIAGDRFLPTLNLYRPALSQTNPITNRPRDRLARRVVVVIIDGLRQRDSYGLPYLDSIRRVGIDAVADSHYPTFSRPNYVTIVTGVPPRYSGVRTNDYNAPSLIDSLMDRTGEAGLTSGFISNYSPGLPVLFTRPATAAERAQGSAEFKSDFDDMHYVQWPGGFVNASLLLLEQGHPLIVMLHGAADDTGHEHGADSDEYRDAAKLVDRELGEALRPLDLQRDAVIIVADHGHTDGGGHGGLEPEVVEVPLIMAGAGIRPGAAVVDARLIDVAPTAAALLGVSAPGHALGRTLVEAMIIAPETRRQLIEADQLRIVRNQAVVAAAEKSAAKTVTHRRAWRFPAVILLFATTVFLLLGARKLGALRVDWRVLLIGIPAFPITYYALLGAFGQSFSPSLIPERGSIITALLKFGLVSTAAHVVAAWFALRGRVVLRDRLAAANALTIIGLFTSLLPAGLFWAVFPGPHVDLPSPAQMVFIPATLIAAACFALASTVTLSLEVIIFFARAIDPRIRLRRLERAAARVREQVDDDEG